MADDTNNVSELEFRARVNGESFDAAEAEVKARTERTFAQAKREAENAARATAVSAPPATQVAPSRDIEKTKNDVRILAETVVAARREVASLNTSFGSLASNNFGENITIQAQRGQARLFQLRRELEQIRAELRTGAGRGMFLEELQESADQISERIRVLRTELRGVTQEALGAGEAMEGGGAGGAGGGRGGGRGFGGGFATRRAIMEAGRVAGLGEFGAIAGEAAYGGPFIAVAAVTGLALGYEKLVAAGREADQSNIQLAASAHLVGTSFEDAAASSLHLQNQLGATVKEANQIVSVALDIKRATAGLTDPGQVAGALSRVGQSQGLDAAGIASLGEQLKGLNPDAIFKATGREQQNVFEEYARSIGKTSDKLTDLDKHIAVTKALVDHAKETAPPEPRGVFESIHDTLKRNYDYYYGGGRERAEADAIGERDQAARQAGIKDAVDRAYRQGFIITVNDAGRVTSSRNIDEESRRNPFKDFETYRYSQFGGNDKLAREGRQGLADQYKEAQQFYSGQSDLDLPRGQSLTEIFRQRRAFESRKGIFEGDDISGQRGEIGQGFFQAISRFAEEAEGKVKSLRQNIEGSLGEFANLQLPRERNPFVKLYTDAEEAGRKAEERFRLFGDDVGKQYEKMQRAALDAQIYDVRVTETMKAVHLEFEAADLARPFRELTGEMKRAIAVMQVEVTSAIQNPSLLAQADLVLAQGTRRNAKTGRFEQTREINRDYVLGQEFSNIRQLQEKYGNVPGLGGDEIRHQLDQQLAGLYGQLSPEARGTLPTQYRQAFASAFRGEATYNDQQIRRAAERADVQRGAVREAETKLRELDRLSTAPGADRDRTRAEYLSIVGNIPREELTPAMLKGRIEADKEEAVYRRSAEERAKKAVEDARKFQVGLIGEDGRGGALGRIEEQVKNRNERTLVHILDESNQVHEDSLGRAYGDNGQQSTPTSGNPLNDLGANFGGLFQ